MPIRRRSFTFASAALIALAVAAGPSGAESTPTGGANNLVLVQLSNDGATQARASTQVVPVGGDTVTSANIASATNTACVGCHSTAVAVQILIVTGTPSYFAPGNVAAAANGGCDSCGAYAYARQHWIQTSGPAHLDGTTRLRVAQLRQEISDAAASILPSDVATDPCVPHDGVVPDCQSRDEMLDEKLNALTTELIQVVTSGLQSSGTTTATLFDQMDPAPGS